MKYIYFFLPLLLLLSSCQKTKDDLADAIIKEGIKAFQNAGMKVEIAASDSLLPAKLDFEETEAGIKLKQEINKLNKEASEELQFLKPWVDLTNVRRELGDATRKLNLARQLEDSLKIERSHFKFDTTMVMKRVILRREEQGETITDTAFFYFNKEVTRCIGIKGKEQGFWQYIELPSNNTSFHNTDMSKK
jgi:hypothetical protein